MSVTVGSALAELRRLRERLDAAILPFWSSLGFDQPHGLFHERFDFAGRAVEDAPRRAMVQARQIHVFSHAAQSGQCPDGAEPALRAARSLLDRYGEGRDGEAGFAFAVHRDGSVHSAVRDSYTHAFVLFGLAAAYRLSGEPRLKRAIERTLGFIDRHLADPRHGGLHDRHPGPASAKAQNPQMHLLEAYLALHQACPDGPYLERAGHLVDLLGGRMVRAGGLPEHFAADWSDHADPVLAATFEPGHHFEWAWLLDRYRAASGAPLPEAAAQLWTSACESGGDGAGRLFDAVGFDRRPRVSSHRLWPHAEGVKAAATRAEAGDAAAAGFAATLLRTLNDLFLGRPFPGGWVDRVGPGGEALLDSVPASSLYHLYGAWAEADRVFGPAVPAPRPR